MPLPSLQVTLDLPREGLLPAFLLTGLAEVAELAVQSILDGREGAQKLANRFSSKAGVAWLLRHACPRRNVCRAAVSQNRWSRRNEGRQFVKIGMQQMESPGKALCSTLLESYAVATNQHAGTRTQTLL